MSSLPPVLQGNPVHEAVKPILWILGTWEAVEGKGTYPTITPFTYGERVVFSSLGQPILNYSSHSWHPTKMSAMHLESGFLRIKPGTQHLAFMVSHNFGLTTLEEGEVSDTTISLSSKQISRMSFAKDPEVTKINRTWSLLDEDTLEQVVFMETRNTPLCEHLRVLYKKMS